MIQVSRKMVAFVGLAGVLFAQAVLANSFLPLSCFKATVNNGEDLTLNFGSERGKGQEVQLGLYTRQSYYSVRGLCANAASVPRGCVLYGYGESNGKFGFTSETKAGNSELAVTFEGPIGFGDAKKSTHRWVPSMKTIYTFASIPCPATK